MQTKSVDFVQYYDLIFLHRAKEFVVPSLCFALHTTLALAALAELSIPMYV